jgi:flap endonuclease-1
VFATAAEDMDALTFGSSVVLRHMTASEQKKLPIREINLDHLLAEIGLTQSQFIDLCILLGCDYCDSMKGVGPAKGLGLVRQHGSIENIIANNPKLNVPENWLYQEARQLFVNPEVTDADDVKLKWSKPDEAGLLQFMVEEKGFSADRIKNGIRKLEKQ